LGGVVPIRETRPIRGRATRWRRRLPIAPALLILLGFFGSGAVGAMAYFLPVIVATLTQTGQVTDLPSPSPNAASPTPAGQGQPFTVLLLGSDDDEKFDKDRYLTQSMILVRVNPATRQVTMMSIPRDLYVPLAGGGSAKIMDAFAYDGARGAIATVERNFQVHVDEYIWVGLKGLIKAVDTLGGVDMITSNPVLDDYYPNDVDTENPFSLTRIAVLPGAQHLDGMHALQYVRSRHSDLRQDFGRSFRQQQLLIALRAKAKTLNASDLPDLANAMSGEIKTSMSLDRVRDLIPIANQVGSDNIRQIILLPPYTGSSSLDNGQSILIPNWSLILPLVREVFP
jgi:LCP family protein required for cell wall assembly